MPGGPPLLLLPGMGADHTLYAHLRCRRPLRLVDWPTIDPRWRVEELAQALITRDQIRPGDWVGGVSMGGIVAQAIARLVPLGRVVLISSCRHPRAIAPWLWRLARLARYAPLESLGTLPALPVRAPHRQLLLAMAQRADPAFVRWAAVALARWPGAPALATPLHHLHGRDDAVMPLRWSRPDTVIPGGHFIVLTRARQVSRWIDALGDAAPMAVLRPGAPAGGSTRGA